MKPLLIVYATREGHTHLIASHIGEALTARGFPVEVRDARDVEGTTLDPSPYAGAILAASVHLGRHEKEMAHFIQRNHAALDQLPTAFLSVSLAAAAAQDETRPAEQRAEVTRALAKTADALFEETGWNPARVQFVAGALMYTKYNAIVRWVMKRIARAEGTSTDTAHDHVYTDWEGVDRFVDEFVHTLGAGEAEGTAGGTQAAAASAS
jgi:menaquinone-dependent protoporphyrinogen oxidase